jgi:hypothetical protein
VRGCSALHAERVDHAGLRKEPLIRLEDEAGQFQAAEIQGAAMCGSRQAAAHRAAAACRAISLLCSGLRDSARALPPLLAFVVSSFVVSSDMPASIG